MLYDNILDVIGKTPLVRLKKVEEKYSLKVNLYAKLESFNPSNSVKARAALGMIKDYLSKGLIDKDTILIEPTSGNTGIALAMIAAYLENKLIITMPENMSVERIKLMRAYGAEVILTPKTEGMSGAIKKAKELNNNNPNSIIIGQFENYANSNIHYATTAKEIYTDLDGKIDIFIAGIGTGGTISGCAKYFKEQNKSIKIIGVEPSNSAVLNGHTKGAHKIQGIGAGFKPEILELENIDEILMSTDEDAYEYARILPKLEGILVGISSGATLGRAIEVAKNLEGGNVVVLLADSGERYLSTDLYE